LNDPPRLFIDIHNKQVAKTIVVKPDTLAAKSRPAPFTAKPRSTSDVPAASPVVKAVVDKKPAQFTNVSSSVSSPVKKTIVDADDDDDDKTLAKLDTQDVRPAASLADTPTSLDRPRVGTSSSGKGKHKPTSSEAIAREAQPTASGDRSLIRALGLKIGKIVIDPGHGGHDTGTIGPHGLEEKDLVLDVSRRLGRLLEARLGAEVIFTRKDDTFIPLETRTSIANQEEADLFVSVHANSSRDPDARGVETYYLNFTSSSDALDVAARENAASDKSIHELQDLVKKIALKEKIEESQEFASDVQQSLHSGLATKNPGLRNRGVKKAPFIVLIGANMPSILAEISFVSNPGDEHRLRTPEYRQRIAESLYHGISKYVGGLSGVKVASKMDKGVGQ
jgi:N-acetylmuramoyl-L-alanine amidase